MSPRLLAEREATPGDDPGRLLDDYLWAWSVGRYALESGVEAGDGAE